MPYSYTQVTGTGMTNVFPVSFPYISRAHVRVTLDDIVVNPANVEWLSDTSIRLSPTPSSGVTIRIFRETPIVTQIVRFREGVLDSKDLNSTSLQLLYALQEGLDNGTDIREIAEEIRIISEAVQGAATQILVDVPDLVDAATFLTEALNSPALIPGSSVVIRSNYAPIRIENRVQITKSGVDFNFVTPIRLGARGAIRAKGDFEEIWRGEISPATGLRVENTGDIPSVFADSFDDPATGNLVLPMLPSQIGQFAVGDYVVIRGFISSSGLSAIEKQNARIASIDLLNHRLYLDRPRAVHTDEGDAAEMGKVEGDVFTFSRRYFGPDGVTPLQSPTGEGLMSTRVKVVRAAFPTGNIQPNTRVIPISSNPGLVPGDLVAILDDRREMDIDPQRSFKSRIVVEMALVMAASPTSITLSAPTSRSYLTAFEARIVKIDAVVGCSIRAQTVTYSALQDSRNYAALQLDFCKDSKIHGSFVDGRGGRKSEAVRLSYSYNCSAHRNTVLSAASWGSGEGYGITDYYGTNNKIERNHVSDCRHSFLCQGSTDTLIGFNTSEGDRINAVDAHGTWCIRVRIEGNTLKAGTLNTPDASDNFAIVVGNTSHVIHDLDSIVKGNTIVGYTKTTNSAGIAVTGSADRTLIADNTIMDCDTGIRMRNMSSLNTVALPVEELHILRNIIKRVRRGVDVRSYPLVTLKRVLIADNDIDATETGIYLRDLTVSTRVLRNRYSSSTPTTTNISGCAGLELVA